MFGSNEQHFKSRLSTNKTNNDASTSKINIFNHCRRGYALWWCMALRKVSKQSGRQSHDMNTRITINYHCARQTAETKPVLR
jgi:hypothetical protein